MKLTVEYNKRVDMELNWHEYLALCGILRNAPDDGQSLKMKVRTQIVTGLSEFEDKIPAGALAI